MTLNYVRSAPVLLLCAAIFTAFPVLAGQHSTTVTAVVLPQGPYSKLAIREMGREAAHILKQSGASLHWRIGVPPDAVSGSLIVVRLVGHCDMDGSPSLQGPGPLGWAHEVNGTMLPFSNLACDNLRGAVESAVIAGNPLRGNILLGRAMGRVLAHELYHIIADTATHSRDGVARAALSPRDLTSGQLELEPSQVANLESGLGGAR